LLLLALGQGTRHAGDSGAPAPVESPSAHGGTRAPTVKDTGAPVETEPGSRRPIVTEIEDYLL
jgi:hypothetical protein